MKMFDNPHMVVRRFELLRRVLMHTTGLSDDQLDELTKYRELTVGMLQAYARLLEQNVQTTYGRKLPAEVAMPEIDLTDGTITYASRNTRIVVNVYACTIQMERAERAIDPSSPVHAAMAVLAGYLELGDGARWLDRPAAVIDVKVAAEVHLAKVIGAEEAGLICASYFPHWGAWAIEQETATAQINADRLNAARLRLQQGLAA